MISRVLPFSGPTALAVSLAGCYNIPISLNVHLMYLSSLMTAGQDRPYCYLRFLPAKFQTVITTVGYEILLMFLNVTHNATKRQMAKFYAGLLCVCTYIYLYIYLPGTFLRKPKRRYLKNTEKSLNELFSFLF